MSKLIKRSVEPSTFRALIGFARSMSVNEGSLQERLSQYFLEYLADIDISEGLPLKCQDRLVDNFKSVFGSDVWDGKNFIDVDIAAYVLAELDRNQAYLFTMVIFQVLEELGEYVLVGGYEVLA